VTEGRLFVEDTRCTRASSAHQAGDWLSAWMHHGQTRLPCAGEDEFPPNGMVYGLGRKCAGK
jgi:hypothetical protein